MVLANICCRLARRELSHKTKHPIFFSPKVILITYLFCQIILGTIAIILFTATIILLPHTQLITLLWHYTLGGILAVVLILVIQKYHKIGLSIFGLISIIGYFLVFNNYVRELVGLPIID